MLDSLIAGAGDDFERALGYIQKKDSLYKLRFQHSINQLDNPHKIVETKKDIARVLTVLREKEINGNA